MRLQLDPIDTLFFRDGTPFAADSSAPSDAGGLFPPFPSTITGALRAALARRNGWSGTGRWPASLNLALGPGPEDLGLLSFTGPFLLLDGKPLFPAPLHLQGTPTTDGWIPRALLQPGTPVRCDLGDAVRLPDLPDEIQGHERRALKPGDGWWLNPDGLKAVLRGDVPAQHTLVHARQLWQTEPRIGIEREVNTRTAASGRLYTSRHVRLARGVGLGVEIHGLGPEWNTPYGSLVPLGGESRLVECRAWDQALELDSPLATISTTGRLLILALTPLALPLDQALGRVPLTGWPHTRVISACLGPPQRIGGWDSLARRPLPLQSFLPAGSVLFCELSDPAALAAATAETPPRLGARQRWGYGAVALGTWRDPLD